MDHHRFRPHLYRAAEGADLPAHDQPAAGTAPAAPTVAGPRLRHEQAQAAAPRRSSPMPEPPSGRARRFWISEAAHCRRIARPTAHAAHAPQRQLRQPRMPAPQAMPPPRQGAGGTSSPTPLAAAAPPSVASQCRIRAPAAATGELLAQSAASTPPAVDSRGDAANNPAPPQPIACRAAAHDDAAATTCRPASRLPVRFRCRRVADAVAMVRYRPCRCPEPRPADAPAAAEHARRRAAAGYDPASRAGTL